MLALLLWECKGNTPGSNDDSNLSLYSEPVVVPINTKNGYTVNILTGDSIKPLFNSFGDTIKTGIPVPLIIKEGNKEEIAKRTTIEGVEAIQTIIPDNVYPIPGKLSATPVDTIHLKKVKLG